MDAQQFRFPSLAPRVERGLPWSLPRPFCLSPGFCFPVDPYRTGEFRLAVSVASHGVVGGGATHTMPGFVLSKEVFCFDKILWASYLAVHAHELSVLLHYAHSGLTHNRKEILRAAGAGSVDIPDFGSHLHCCGVCPGRRGSGVD